VVSSTNDPSREGTGYPTLATNASGTCKGHWTAIAEL
jgi:hypothetical protein